MKSAKEMPPPPGRDRRSGLDRRQRDEPPPAGIERRRSIEARKPEVREVELSDTDWGRLLDAND